MEVKILASSSAGNAYLIQDDDKSILIECGLRFKELQKKTGFNLSDIDICLISHEHKDHCRCVHDLLKMGIRCAMSEGTAREIGLDNRAIYLLESERVFTLNGWSVLPFKTVHDAIEPLGFLICTPSGEKICYASDTCYLEYKFKAVTHWLIECNYSKMLLEENKDLPQQTKDRIMMTHFELINVIDFFRQADLSKTKRICIIHLSDDNADPVLFTKAIEQATLLPVYTS